MSKVSIIGAYNTKFGSFVEKNRETGEIKDLKSYYDLIIEAGQGALKDAGVEAKDIDGIWLGTCSPSMFVNQEHASRSYLHNVRKTPNQSALQPL